MKKGSIGVVVGRFQTPYLHAGHMHLLNQAYRRHANLCVVLGTHGGAPCDTYPLDTASRTKMIHMHFPEAKVLNLNDMPSNHVWSMNLDELLKKEFGDEKITLYGSRDSFLDVYDGKYPKRKVSVAESKSATMIRKEECNEPADTIEFRRGMIYSTLSRFPIVYNTVDVATYRQVDDVIEVLLGRKNGDGGKYRFVGGFVDPTDKSLARAGKRELWEEVGMIEVAPLEYIGSMKIDDYRYKGTRDSVMSTLFIAKYLWGGAQAQDDLDEVRWVKIDELIESVADGHKEIASLFKEAISNKFSKQ